jgi:hypothetical protein
MIVAADPEYAQLVDFGMSCITVRYDNAEYTIKAGPGYRHSTACIEQQDMGMLLMDMSHNYDVSDANIQRFLDMAIPPSMKPNVANTPMYKRRMAIPSKIAYYASYNRSGTFYPTLPAADLEALKTSVVVEKLREVFEAVQTGGKRIVNKRKSRRRRTVKVKRVSK